MAEEEDEEVMADSEDEGLETDGDGPADTEGKANRGNMMLVGGIIVGVVFFMIVCGLGAWAIANATGNTSGNVALTTTVQFIETANAGVVASMTADFSTQQAGVVDVTPTPDGREATATPGEIAAVTTEAPSGGGTPESTNTPVIPPSATNTPLFSPTPDANASPTALGGAVSETPNPAAPTDTPVPTDAVASVEPSPTNRGSLASRTPTQPGAALTNVPGTPGTPGGTAIAAVSGTPGTPGTPRATSTRNPLASPTALPNTGFADEFGLPGLILAALALIVVVVIVRRLRLSLR